MDAEDFRKFGKAAVDFIADYVENLGQRNVLPDVQPGYLLNQLSEEIPERGENWQKIFQDFQTFVMPGITHWQSPHFHAFYPTGSSYPSVIGELLSAALGVIGLHWLASPACTELEVVTMNWLGKLLDLPEAFLNCAPGPGGGVIQGSASESTLLCVLAAKFKTLRNYEGKCEDASNKLICYTTDQANSSVEKSGILSCVQMKILSTNREGVLDGNYFEKVVADDVNAGFLPCCMVATFGTTGTCAFDELNVLGPVCERYHVWLHVDAAYAGSALILPEYRKLLKGVEYADSFNFNPHKWLMVNFDCSALWVKNSNDLIEAFSVDRIYLKSDQKREIPEYRNWQIPLGRKFRALKLWFTLKAYGKEGLRAHIKNHVDLAKRFADLIDQDDRFEIVAPVSMGLVCFRIKGENELTQRLHERILATRKLYMIVATVNGKLALRFVVCGRQTVVNDIHYAWAIITEQTAALLKHP